MRMIIFFIFSLMLMSCGDDADEQVTSGFSTQGIQASCITDIESNDPRPGTGCTLEFSEQDDINRIFKSLCNDNGGDIYSCLPCGREVLCSQPLNITIKGYSLDGFLKSNIPFGSHNYCSNNFLVYGDEDLRFRDRCEAAGFKATLVGCSLGYYLCSGKI